MTDDPDSADNPDAEAQASEGPADRDGDVLVDDADEDEAPVDEGATAGRFARRRRRARLPRLSHVGSALVVGSLMVVALSGSAGWLGYRAYEKHEEQAQRDLFVSVARQGAVNLTTIDYTHVDADVQRVLDLATGAFRDDFEQRSKPFIEVVRAAQSKSEGTVTDAGLESQHGDAAQVLVAVAVKSRTAGGEQSPREWRMRIDVKSVGNDAKVSNVVFVP